jgi:hypothetical protein
MAADKTPTDHIGAGAYAVSDPVELLYMWRNEGLTPLVLVKGFAECLLEGEIGTLNSRQQEAMQVIDRRCLEAIQRWHEFGNFFCLNSPDREPRSPAEVSDEELAFLQEHIFKEALASLYAVKERSDILLREGLGTLTDEQREAIDVINHRCQIAIERWNQPIVYFSKSGRA